MKKNKKAIAAIVVLFLLAVCITLFLNKCSGGRPENTLPVADGEEWNGENVNGGDSAQGQEYISIPGYTELYADADKPEIQLVNPDGNTVYFKYAIFIGDELIHETELIKPGELLRWDAHDTLAAGEYRIEIKISTYDLTTQARCNGASMPARLRVSA